MKLWRPLLLSLCVALSAQAGQQCLTLAFNGNVGGKIEDCGCPKRPLGGLTHRAAMLGELQANCEHTLVVDAGNLLGREDFEGGLAQTEFLLAESRAMGLKVLGVGERELGFGLDFARNIPDAYGLQLVSTNLVRGDEAVFSPSHVETVGRLRVGFVSVLGTESLPEGLDLVDPAEALQRTLPALREDADVIVLLANLPRGEVRQLLAGLPAEHGIDFVIDGQSKDHYERAQELHGATLLAANAQGKYLGELRLTLNDGQWTGDSSFTLQAVDIAGPGDDAVQARVEAFVKEREKLAAANSR